MGIRTKVQNALRYLPTLFDSDIGKRNEAEFQLVRCDSPTPGQIRRTLSSSSAVDTPPQKEFHVDGNDSVLRTTRDHDDTQLLDTLTHDNYHGAPLVSVTPLEVSVKLDGSYGSQKLRQYLRHAGSNLLARSTCTPEASLPAFLNQRLTNLFTGAKVEPFSQWLSYADTYIAELIRSEGRGDSTDGRCNRCLESLCDGLGIRCEDCYDQGLLCTNCCVYVHSRHPFHRIKVCTTNRGQFASHLPRVSLQQKWSNDQFQHESLRLLGLRLDFGHEIGKHCPHPAYVESFTVFDVTGIHEVRVRFCECRETPQPFVQLLRKSLFPASSNNPRAAATFRLLEQYTLLSAFSDLTARGFYKSLVRMSNKTGLSPPAVCDSCIIF